MPRPNSLVDRIQRQLATFDEATGEARTPHDDYVDSVRAASASRLPPIIDDPFVPTPEQGEALERINQLKQLIGMRGHGGKRRALEQRLAKLVAELPPSAVPAPQPPVVMFDPAQAGAPGGTVAVTSYRPASQHRPVTPPMENPTRVAGETVQVRGAIDGRPLTVRRSVQDDFVALLNSARR